MSDDTGAGWTADELIAELDRRLEAGRLSISAHKREVGQVRWAANANRRLPKLPKRDSPGWMVKEEQRKADKKQVKRVADGNRAAAKADGEQRRVTEGRAAVLASPLAINLQREVENGQMTEVERDRRLDAAVAARLAPPVKAKRSGFWASFDSASNNG